MVGRIILFIMLCVYMPLAQGCSSLLYNVEGDVAIKNAPLREGVKTGKTKIFTYTYNDFVIFENDTGLFVKTHYRSDSSNRLEFYGINKKLSDRSIKFDKNLIKKHGLRTLVEFSKRDAKKIAAGQVYKDFSKVNKIIFWVSYNHHGGGDLIIEFADFKQLVEEVHRSIREYDETLVLSEIDDDVRQFIDRSIFVEAIKRADTNEKLVTLRKIAKSLGYSGVDSDLRKKDEMIAFNAEQEAAIGASLDAKKIFIKKHSNRTASGDDCFVVTASSLNIRQRHYGNANKVGVYSQGDVVCRQGSYGEWMQTEKGWVSSKYLNKWGTDGYSKKINEIQVMVDSEDFSIAQKANTVASYTAYLSEHPSGKYKSKATQLLAARYADLGTFEGFMNAYKIIGEYQLIVDAYGAAMEVKQKAPVPLELVALYFTKGVKKISDVPKFAKLLAQIDGYDDGEALYKHFKHEILGLPGFGERLTATNFTDSIEYKYVFKNERPKIKSIVDGEKFGLTVVYGDKKFKFTKTADCQYTRNYSEKRDLGFFEGLGSALGGGVVKNKTIYYDVYRCSAPLSKLEILRKLEKNLVSTTIACRQIKNKSGWEDHRYTGKIYNKGGGGSGSGGSSSDYVMVNFDPVCGIAGCIGKNLDISGGPGDFSSSFSGASSGAIHKGYNGLAGTYNWSAQIDDNKSCSGSLYLSGEKGNYTIRVYDSCSDAGSNEY